MLGALEGRGRLSIGRSESGGLCTGLSRCLELSADDRGMLGVSGGLLRHLVLLSLLLRLLVLHRLCLVRTGSMGLITLLDLVTLFDRPGGGGYLLVLLLRLLGLLRGHLLLEVLLLLRLRHFACR